MKEILILADFLGPLDGTFNSRFLYLADILAKENVVEVVTSDFDHGSKSYFDHEIEKHAYPITLLHEGAYKRNVSPGRFYGHWIWARNVRKYLELRQRPDVIYCAVPTLAASYVAARYCEENGVRFVIDIQDLWPEAFRMAFDVPVLSDVAFAPFTVLANGIYKRADAVCAVSQTYVDRALRVNNKADNGVAVYLGTDLAMFDAYAAAHSVLEKGDNEIWLAYCGTLGASYRVDWVIDAMSMLGDGRLKLVVMGDGPKRTELEEYARDKGVQVTFMGMLDYGDMCALLVHCDIAVNPIEHNAAQSIINKHADYAAAGLPVVNTQESLEYRSLVMRYDMGFNCANSDVEKLASAIEELAEDPALRERMGANARRCFKEKFNRDGTYRVLEKAILAKGEVAVKGRF